MDVVLHQTISKNRKTILHEDLRQQRQISDAGRRILEEESVIVAFLGDVVVALGQ